MREHSAGQPARFSWQLAMTALLLALAACGSPGPGASPVSDVSVTSVPRGVLVEWTGGEGATELIIYRSENGSEYLEIDRVPAGRTSYADYTVDVNSSYYYAVAALGAEPVVQSSDEPVSPRDGVLLTVLLDGGGTVLIEGAAAPVACQTDCVVGFEPGDQAVLTGVGGDLAFAGFSSPCPPTATCALELETDTQVTALFRSHVLRITLEGGAAVDADVAPGPDGALHSCRLEPGNDCLLGYDFTGGDTLQVSVNVTTVEDDAVFLGFGGACTEPQGRYCLVAVQGATEVIVRATAQLNANPDTYQAAQGETLTVEAPGVLANDDAVAGATARLEGSSGAGSVDLRPDGSFTYTPSGDPSGPAAFTFTYSIVGPFEVVSDPATVTIDIVPRPVANDDTYVMFEDGVLDIDAPGVLENDQYGGDASVELVDSGVGELDLEANGAFTYRPPQDFAGQVSFTYRIVGPLDFESAPAEVNITVLPVNDPPIFRLSQTEVRAGPNDNVNLPGFAVDIGPGGGPDEASQNLQFDVVPVGGTNLRSGPSIAVNNGMLTFRTWWWPLFQPGTYTYRVTLHDNGGTENGGQPQSEPVTFRIVLTSDPDSGGGGGGGGGGGDDDDDDDDDRVGGF